MTYQQMHALRTAEPFLPFIIHLADGRSVTVHHPELMIFSPKRRTVIVYQPDEHFNIIDLKLITDLEVQPKAGAKK